MNNLDAISILRQATEEKAADIFIVAGIPVSYKVNGTIRTIGERLMPGDTEVIVRQIYELAGKRNIDPFLHNGDDDFSFAIPGLSRYRVSTYMQRGSLHAARFPRFRHPHHLL